MPHRSAIAVIGVLLVAGTLWVTWNDWRHRRIPNLAILAGLALGLGALALAPASIPARGFVDAGLGLLVGFAWTFPGYLVRQLGAGDVKYAATIGWLSGAWPGLYAQLYGMLALGGLGLAVLIARNRFALVLPTIPAGVALSAGFNVFLWQYWNGQIG